MTLPIPHDGVIDHIVNATRLRNDVVSIAVTPSTPPLSSEIIPHGTPHTPLQPGITIAPVWLVTLPVTMFPRLLPNKQPPTLRADPFQAHSHPNQALTLTVGHGNLPPKIVIPALTSRISPLVQHQHQHPLSHTLHILLISLLESIRKNHPTHRTLDNSQFQLGPSLTYPLLFRVTHAFDTTTIHTIAASTSTGTISVDSNTPLTLTSKLSKTFHYTERTKPNHIFISKVFPFPSIAPWLRMS